MALIGWALPRWLRTKLLIKKVEGSLKKSHLKKQTGQNYVNDQTWVHFIHFVHILLHGLLFGHVSQLRPGVPFLLGLELEETRLGFLARSGPGLFVAAVKEKQILGFQPPYQALDQDIFTPFTTEKQVNKFT